MFKKSSAFVLAFLLVFCSLVCADAHDLEDFKIENINLPDRFSWCTREDVSKNFSAMLSRSGFSHEKWVKDIMEPQSLYICGQDASGNQINIAVKKPEEDTREGIEIHNLMYDYNIIAENSRGREKLMVQYRNVLSDGGIDKEDIIRIRWYETKEDRVTPFIMGLYKDGESYICQYRTIYAGNNVNFSYVSKDKIDDETISTLDKMVSEIVFAEKVDYSQAKHVYRQNQKVRIPTGEKSLQKNSDYLLIVAAIFIVSVLVFSIYETTNKSRKRNKSKKETKVGKY